MKIIGESKMVLLKTKLTNQLYEEAKKRNVDVEIVLKNVSVSGTKRGCSGHVVSKSTGSCVYLNTESSVYGPLSDKVMYRLARDVKDYSSNSLVNGDNRWCKPEELASLVIGTLSTEKGIDYKTIKKKSDALAQLCDDSYLY